ncbi:hypothetical protein ACLB2K_060830 [Fragaria x ananassa]
MAIMALKPMRMVPKRSDFSQFLLLAIQNVHLALLDLGIRKIAISTTFSFVNVVTAPFPPSTEQFIDAPLQTVIRPRHQLLLLRQRLPLQPLPPPEQDFDRVPSLSGAIGPSQVGLGHSALERRGGSASEGGTQLGYFVCEMTNKYKNVDYRSKSDSVLGALGFLKMVVGQFLVFAFLLRGNAAISKLWLIIS